MEYKKLFTEKKCPEVIENKKTIRQFEEQIFFSIIMYVKP